MKSFTALPLYTFLLALGSFALSAPTTPSPKTISEIIDFEDKAGNPVLPAISPVGIDKGLNFISFVIVDSSLAVVGIKPHSGKNSAVTAIEQQALTGTPTITTKGTTTKLYDLKSFYFACAVNSVEGAEGVPAQCTILVAGFKGNQEKVVATYTFTPTLLGGGLLKPMIQAVLPKEFTQLQSVTVIQDDPTAKALLIDDLSVTLYQ